MGKSTLCNNTTGSSNHAVGKEALLTNTTGNYNTAMGYHALYGNTTGCYNNAIGRDALRGNTTGGCNIAIGCQALRVSLSGNDNFAAGQNALYCNWGGCYNNAIGAWSLQVNTTGTDNQAIGRYALNSNTTGGCNIGIGAHALRYNTTGLGNVAMGYSASRCNTTGDFNTALGCQALYNNTDGDNNTSLGFRSGRYLADGSTALTSPDNSTYLGTCTRGCAVGDTNVTVIGYCACACGDNTVSIGNGNVTNTYINGTTTVTGNVSASGDGYFACVIAGGYLEEKAASPKLAEYPTGSIVVIGGDGDLVLSTREYDTKVFGVTKQGVCQPIVLGAEPVLVTGDIKVGDFITTSDKPGHGKGTSQTIHGSVIAQALEAGTGCSYILKAMVRKM
jgi:hypothetical protein